MSTGSSGNYASIATTNPPMVTTNPPTGAPKKLIDKYNALDIYYNDTRVFYEKKISGLINKINSPTDGAVESSTGLPAIISESNVKLNEILDKLNLLGAKINNMEEAKVNRISSEMGGVATASGSQTGELYNRRLIAERSELNNKLLTLSKNENELSSSKVERKSGEIQIVIFSLIFIGVLCIIARVYIIETVGIVETIILMSGIAILLYYFIKYLL
jgi:hypothetical protein